MRCRHCQTRNPDGMRYCGMCGRPLQAAPTHRERRRVTVVFLDLVGFADLTRDADAETVRDLADEVLTVATAAVEAHGGRVDAYRGDGLMAVFGAPRSHPDDPERAVRAAGDAIDAIAALGRRRSLPLSARAGVNTGTVVAGAIGAGDARADTVMGSAVNLAARLEEAAGVNEVWVGPETYDALRTRFAFEPTDPLTLPGFPDVRLAHRWVPTPPTSVDVPPFVGRTAERRALAGHCAAVKREGRVREVWITGEVGMGKTRLLDEVFAMDGGDGGAVAACERIVPLLEGAADAPPWRTLADAVFPVGGGPEPVGAAPHDATPSQRPRRPAEPGSPSGPAGLDLEVIERGLATLLPGEPRWWRTILTSLDVLEAPTWRRVERRRVDRTALAWRDLVAARARRGSGPWAFVLDVEPAHPSTLAFLALLREVRAPILVLRTARDARDVPRGAHHVPLEPLAPPDAEALVKGLVGDGDAVARAVATWVPHTDATPGHLIELGRALAHDVDAAHSPSIQALVGARLDRLDGPARDLLARAALAGEEVWEGLVRTLGDDPRGRRVATLVREGMLVPAPTSRLPRQRAYRFQSPLLRAVALERLPYAERAEVHVRIGTWLEGHAPLEMSAAIATQFERGGVPDAAYAHALAAADVASWTGTLEEMHGLFAHVTQLDVGLRERAVATRDWVEASLRRGDVAAARAAHAMLTDQIGDLAPPDAAALERDRAQLAKRIEAAPVDGPSVAGPDADVAAPEGGDDAAARGS